MIDALSRLAGHVVDILPVVALCILAGFAARGSAALAIAWRGRREFSTNLGIWLTDIAVVAPLVIVPAVLLTKAIPAPAALVTLWQDVPPVVVALAALLAGDLIGYWRHRCEHNRWIWPAHAVHHSDEEMGWSAVYRIHPFNRLSTVTIDVFALSLLGFPPAAVALNFVVRNAWGTFIHADLPWTLGAIGRVLISPAAHRVHHAADEALAGSNFATVFTFWDRAFGTWQSPQGLEQVATGIAGGSRGFIGELARPFEAARVALQSNSNRRSAEVIPQA